MITMPPNKTFDGDFDSFLKMLEGRESFAFSRFSDGEVFMMQGQEIVMAADHCKVKGRVHRISYPEDDYKHYDPEQHEFYREKLVEAFVHRQKNYFKGLSCRCCIGEADFKWQIELIEKGYDDCDQGHLTWSNLLINANYLKFLKEMYPVIFTYPIVMTVNKNAQLGDLGLDIKKEFRVGPNCIVNDYSIIEEMLSYIRNNEITGHLFLFAASSLSNMAIHQLYKEFPSNTYMDIGSSLNPFMPGIGSRRSYMNQLNTEQVSYKLCIW